ncbi:hypothetical protein Sjap_020893 [Stephania japonica]|uniref:BHLH domain-containing protein n=1 Tax=Stephania japonica TaxID=461633 RepID=A0AAP0F2F8_9MAGN
MATGFQNQEGVQENQLRKQLAVAVRSIQWSYAIFWSNSTRQQGVLEWGDGYYNGDIKTRKTVQPLELNVDKLGLKRSEQLRELYESLSVDSSQQARRPSASLSPEDLTDAEWYYLVCMSFTFSPGQGMPGRALVSDQHIWLRNAHYAESKVFSRSLLAKSASVQTVVCFPFWGGVVELGATELVAEDLNLLQHVKTVFLEFPKLICLENKSTSSPQNAGNDEDPVCAEMDNEVLDPEAFTRLNPVAECGTAPEGTTQFPFSFMPYIPKEEIEIDTDRINQVQANVCEELRQSSPNASSDGCELNQNTEDSFMLDGVNGGASQVQSWQFIDEEFSNCIHGSMNSSDCISRTFFCPEKVVYSPNMDNGDNAHLQVLQECNQTKVGSLDIGTDDIHYAKTLSIVFKNSKRLAAPISHSRNHKSCFANWKKGGSVDFQKPVSNSQRMLKKILFDVAWMHDGSSLKSHKENGSKGGVGEPVGDDAGVGHFLLERRREKLNEQFLLLRSLVPSISKFDKASILGDTIEYLKELEKRVEELEGCKESADFETKETRKCPDVVERTSDNYGSNGVTKSRKAKVNKRKASDIVDLEPDLNWVFPKDGLSVELTIYMSEKEVLIEMHSPWRESLLLEVIDAINNLQLDAHSVQSSTSDGILTIILKSKFRGAGVLSPGMIKQAIQRIVDASA